MTIYLYIGEETDPIQFDSGSKRWRKVKEQIVGAINAGRGLIVIPRDGTGPLTYVYSPAVPIRWVEA